MDIITQVQEQIAQVARPLADRLLVVDHEIETRAAELAELKKLRTQLQNTIKSLDPSLLPEQEKPKKKSWMPKVASVRALHDFLLANKEEVNGNGGFHAAGLQARYPKELPVAYSTVNKILNMLHEQGAIELHSTGTGGAKFYKVIA